MKSTLIISFLFLFLFPKNTEEWGFFGHKKINELAINTLPDDLRGFYKAHSKQIIKWAVAPDQRRYIIKDEGAKHYIDLDLYDSFPLPKYWNEAVSRYGENYLRERGIVPWNTFFVYRQLVKAMSTKNYPRIIKISADLGHYIADAHVPLHTTSNYNGQFSGQLGIHAFWESRLPELYFNSYDLFTDRATYISDIQSELWIVVGESNKMLEHILELEKNLTLKVGEDKKYAYMQRGKRIVRMPSEYYSSKYNELAGGQVEQRMRNAVQRVGSFWYSAWIDAGEPNLGYFDDIKDSMDSTLIAVPSNTENTRMHDY